MLDTCGSCSGFEVIPLAVDRGELVVLVLGGKVDSVVVVGKSVVSVGKVDSVVVESLAPLVDVGKSVVDVGDSVDDMPPVKKSRQSHD